MNIVLTTALGGAILLFGGIAAVLIAFVLFSILISLAVAFGPLGTVYLGLFLVASYLVGRRVT